MEILHCDTFGSNITWTPNVFTVSINYTKLLINYCIYFCMFDSNMAIGYKIYIHCTGNDEFLLKASLVFYWLTLIFVVLKCIFCIVECIALNLYCFFFIIFIWICKANSYDHLISVVMHCWDMTSLMFICYSALRNVACCFCC